MSDKENRDRILDNIRTALSHGNHHLISPDIVTDRGYPANNQSSTTPNLDRLLDEIRLLSGEAKKVTPADIAENLTEIIGRFSVKKAVMWNTDLLHKLDIAQCLAVNGVENIPPVSEPEELALCDLGITGVDYAIENSGTLVLTSSPEKPRLVSLLPPLHLAILSPECLVGDINDVFPLIKDKNYLVFITGPSRTADIELTVSLGVHGPRSLITWALMKD